MNSARLVSRVRAGIEVVGHHPRQLDVDRGRHDVAEEQRLRGARMPRADQHRLVAGGVAGRRDDAHAGHDLRLAVDELERAPPPRPAARCSPAGSWRGCARAGGWRPPTRAAARRGAPAGTPAPSRCPTSRSASSRRCGRSAGASSRRSRCRRAPARPRAARARSSGRGRCRRCPSAWARTCRRCRSRPARACPPTSTSRQRVAYSQRLSASHDTSFDHSVFGTTPCMAPPSRRKLPPLSIVSFASPIASTRRSYHPTCRPADLAGRRDQGVAVAAGATGAGGAGGTSTIGAAGGAAVAAAAGAVGAVGRRCREDRLRLVADDPVGDARDVAEAGQLPLVAQERHVVGAPVDLRRDGQAVAREVVVSGLAAERAARCCGRRRDRC